MSKEAFQTQLEDYAKWFHQHPEASYEEYKTTERIARILNDNGIEILPSGLKTGLVAQVKGSKKAEGESHVVAIRGDIDGLPITEESGVPYASVNEGYLHGCGHDYNMTVALGAALLLQRRRDQFAGTVKVIFQPAEEVSADKNTPTGAVAVLRTGVLEDVEVFFGTHDSNGGEPGEYFIGAGPQSGAVDKYRIRIHGKGSHAAHANSGVSPIRPAVALIDGIETISTKNVDPIHPRAISVTHIEAGSTWNVIPRDAFIEGTVRTAYAEDRTLIHDRIRDIANGTSLAYGVEIDFDWEYGSPSVYNDPEWTQFAKDTAASLGLVVREPDASLGGEDFSYYQQEAPGVFLNIGVGNGDRPMHGPTFYPKLDALSDSAELLSRLAQGALSRL